MIQRTLFIVTAPSGAGKTTLVKEVLQRITDLSVSVSYTTRPIRPGEIEGENYHFVDEKKFLSMYSNSISEGIFLFLRIQINVAKGALGNFLNISLATAPLILS